MMTSSSHSLETVPNARTRLLVPAAVAALVAAVLAAGAWGITRHGSGGITAAAAAARIGDAVAVEGGLVRLDTVRDDSIDMSQPMTGPMGAVAGLPDVPAGSRRILLDVTLYAKPPATLRFVSKAFAVVVPGRKKPVSPADLAQGPRLIPPGTATTRTLGFNVPLAARALTLTVEGASQPVAFRVGPPPRHDSRRTGRLAPGASGAQSGGWQWKKSGR